MNKPYLERIRTLDTIRSGPLGRNRPASHLLLKDSQISYSAIVI